VLDFIFDRFIAGLSNQALASSLVCTDLVYLSFPKMVAYCREAQRKEEELQRATVPLNMNVTLTDLASNSLKSGENSNLNGETSQNGTVPMQNGSVPSCVTKIEPMDVTVEQKPIVKIKEEKLDADDRSSVPPSIPLPLPIKTENIDDIKIEKPAINKTTST
jgi:hypothetical protein